jgi:hypothetical protein
VLRPARYAWRCIAWPVAQHQVLALAYCGGQTQDEITGLSGVPMSTPVGDGSPRHRQLGVELGATTTVFPADEAVRTFLRGEGPARRTSPKWLPTPTPTRASARTSSCLLWNVDRAAELARQRGAGLGGGGKPGQRGRARLLGQSPCCTIMRSGGHGRWPPAPRRGQLRCQPPLSGNLVRPHPDGRDVPLTLVARYQFGRWQD